MKINIYGSTGIIGKKSLLILKRYFPNIKINLLVANKNYKVLISQIHSFKPKYIYFNDKKNYCNLNKEIIKNNTKILSKSELFSYLDSSKSDMSLLSISGYESLNYLESIFKNTNNLGLVNKECVVSAGHLFNKLIKKYNVKIFPLDSEHYSLSSSISNINFKSPNYQKIYLTASGGPFLNKKISEFNNISLNTAIEHPKWKMGYKNSIDSATMANKCLEIIEAHYLFHIPFKKLDIVIHPQSLVHSIIEYNNFTSNLNYFYHDMFIPIFNFFNSIKKNNIDYNFEKFKFSTNLNLDFLPVDKKRYPVVKLFDNIDKTNPLDIIKFNCANEYSVNLFIKDIINYKQIEYILQKSLDIDIKTSVKNIRSIIEFHTEYIEKLNAKFL